MLRLSKTDYLGLELGSGAPISLVKDYDLYDMILLLIQLLLLLLLLLCYRYYYNLLGLMVADADYSAACMMSRPQAKSPGTLGGYMLELWIVSYIIFHIVCCL